VTLELWSVRIGRPGGDDVFEVFLTYEAAYEFAVAWAYEHWHSALGPRPVVGGDALTRFFGGPQHWCVFEPRTLHVGEG